jgi:hypothetical protein
MIGMYLNQFHDVTIRPLVADLKRLGLNRLWARPAVQVPYLVQVVRLISDDHALVV